MPESDTADRVIAFLQAQIEELRAEIGSMQASDQQQFPVNALDGGVPTRDTPDVDRATVSGNDTTPGYLADKIVAGTGITVTPLDDGANETLEIAGETLTGPDVHNADRVYSFESWANGDLDGIVMEPGDVWLGPLTVIHWASFTGATTTPPVSSTDTCVWLEVSVVAGSEAVVFQYGSRAAMEAALDATEQQTKLVVPLVETFWSGTEITKVKNLQCGDVVIARA